MTFPGSPRVFKGALIGLDPLHPIASVIVFQYNPETLTRTITPHVAASTSGGATTGEALRLAGPPSETIRLTVEIDATDQLEQGSPVATTAGLHPTIAALEMLLHPRSSLVIGNQILAAMGIIEVVPPEAPLTLLVWGPKRIVPVRLSSLEITEDAFDPALNPVRAKALLTLQVLTYQDLGVLSVGGALSMANQVIKEALATVDGLGGGSSASVSFSVGGLGG